MVKAQEWLDKKYPKETRGEIEEITLEGSFAYGEMDEVDNGGSLKFEGFFNLQILSVPTSFALDSLDLSDCEKLIEVNFSANNLSTLILPKEGKNITTLNFDNNKLSDLSIFANFENLQTLSVNYNNFHGSLDCLSNLTNLKELSIWQEDGLKGLESLPDNLEKIRCGEALKREIQKTLGNINSHYYDYQEWKEKYNQKTLQEVVKKQ